MCSHLGEIPKCVTNQLMYIYIYIHPGLDRIWDYELKNVTKMGMCLTIPYSIYFKMHIGCMYTYIEISQNGGTLKSSIYRWIFHQKPINFWGSPFMETPMHIYIYTCFPSK